MVMCTRTIVPLIDDGEPIFPLSTIPKQQVGQVGEAVLQSQMVGMLNMISVLADYTNEVFSSILKESAGISNRLAIVGKRCESLTARVEATETCINNKTVEQFVTTPKAEYHAPDGVQSQLITPLSSPPHVRKQYEACNPPPNLSALDSFVEGGNCMKLYSDPGFFVQQWNEEQLRLQEEEKQFRRERRAERENRRRKRMEEEQNENLKAGTIKRVTNYVFNMHTGQKEYLADLQPRRLARVRRSENSAGPRVLGKPEPVYLPPFVADPSANVKPTPIAEFGTPPNPSKPSISKLGTGTDYNLPSQKFVSPRQQEPLVVPVYQVEPTYNAKPIHQVELVYNKAASVVVTKSNVPPPPPPPLPSIELRGDNGTTISTTTTATTSSLTLGQQLEHAKKGLKAPPPPEPKPQPMLPWRIFTLPEPDWDNLSSDSDWSDEWSDDDWNAPRALHA